MQVAITLINMDFAKANLVFNKYLIWQLSKNDVYELNTKVVVALIDV